METSLPTIACGHNAVESRDPQKLKNHPLNIEIYGDVADEEFVKSCKGGILTPLIITPGNVVVSGHRRRQAAIKLNMKEVPVFVRRDLKNDLELQLALLDCNRTREKTMEQKAREYSARAEIEAKLARQRQKAAGGDKTKATHKSASGTITGSATGEAKEIAAESVGITRKTAEKALEVVKEIDKAETAGNPEKASELRDALEKSVSAAHRQVKDPAPKADSDAVLDGLKKPVPEKLKAVFESRDEFDALLAKLRNSVAIANTLAKSVGGAHLSTTTYKLDFDNLRRHFRFAMPHAVCPYCAAKKTNCECCKGLGWITEGQYDKVPSELKARIAADCAA